MSNSFGCRIAAMVLVAGCLIFSGGCQAWHSSSAISGLSVKTGDRHVLREAKNDPFPSPSDVGISVK